MTKKIIILILICCISLHANKNEKFTYRFKESKPIKILEEIKDKTSKFHIDNLHYITKLGNRFSPYIKKPIFLNLMPKNNKEYINIYKPKVVSLTAKTQIEVYNKKLEEQGFLYRDMTSNKEITQFIQDSDSTPIILFGHSLQGKTLVLPNSKTVLITDIHKVCKQNNKTCLVLTCDGDDFNIEGKVTALEALEMFNSAYIAFKNKEIFKVKDLKKKMIEKRKSLQNRHRLIISFTIVNISTGATYLVYDFVEEKK